MGRSAQPGIERRRLILKLLRTGSSVDTSELSNRLGVSEMTIRRDLRALENQNAVVRSYGGATLARRIHLEFEFDQRRQGALEAKQAIGRYAASLVEPHETIFVDTGTTTLEFARELARRDIEVTVATSSLAVGSELWGREQIKVLMLGGQLREGSPDLTGPLAEHCLEVLQASKAFLGCDGMHPQRGLFAADSEGARVSATMLRNAAWRCVMADGSKIGRQATVRYAQFEEIDLLVIDDATPAEALQALREQVKQMEVVHVGAGRSKG
ncbi:MAG: DeoR family transcriptional regulator [Phycisphaerae bacterium]